MQRKQGRERHSASAGRAEGRTESRTEGRSAVRSGRLAVAAVWACGLAAAFLVQSACPSGAGNQTRSHIPEPKPHGLARPAQRSPRPTTGPARAAGPLRFSDYFQAQTLRLDLSHEGDAETESYRLTGLAAEGPWPVSR